MEVIIGDEQGRRIFAACSEFISMTDSKGTRLTPRFQLVTCPACRAQIRRARAL